MKSYEEKCFSDVFLFIWLHKYAFICKDAIQYNRSYCWWYQIRTSRAFETPQLVIETHHRLLHQCSWCLCSSGMSRFFLRWLTPDVSGQKCGHIFKGHKFHEEWSLWNWEHEALSKRRAQIIHCYGSVQENRWIMSFIGHERYNFKVNYNIYR